MKKCIFIVAIAIAFYSCSKKEDSVPVPVTFEIQKFKVESQGGCTADTLPCALYEVDFPKFRGLDSAVDRSLKRKIDASVSMGNPEAEGETMEQIGHGFIQDFEDFKSEFKDTPMGWHYSASVAVEVLTDSLISLSVAEEYFTGGAHGAIGTYFVNIRPSTGEDFTLDDFFKTGYEEPVKIAAEKVFRKVRELSDSASLDENFFEFRDNAFHVNTNYGFTKEGVVFYYNSYEIAAYAAGPTEVIVPYEMIKDWIK